MDRRVVLSLVGLSPFAFVSAKLPGGNPIMKNLIKRWKRSKEYTLAVFDTMPENDLEYRPTPEQMSFAQHFMHLGFTNNAFIGIMLDSVTYPDFNALMKAEFFLERPDPINLFQPDDLKKRDAKLNKTLVFKYLGATFDYVISSLGALNDGVLTNGAEKEKPWYLKGHTNLDLILRSENHTAHHRAQAIGYLRMKGVRPPGYSKNNTF